MLLTNPLACPETVQQTGQKHFRGEINTWPLGAIQNSSSQHQAVGTRVSLFWEIRGTNGYGKYGRKTNGPMDMGNTGTEGVREVQGKDQSTRQPTFVCRRTAIHHPHHRQGINPPSPPTQHPPIQRNQAVPNPHQASHHKRSNTIGTRSRTHMFCSELKNNK